MAVRVKDSKGSEQNRGAEKGRGATGDSDTGPRLNVWRKAFYRRIVFPKGRGS